MQIVFKLHIFDIPRVDRRKINCVVTGCTARACEVGIHLDIGVLLVHLRDVHLVFVRQLAKIDLHLVQRIGPAQVNFEILVIVVAE